MYVNESLSQQNTPEAAVNGHHCVTVPRDSLSQTCLLFMYRSDVFPYICQVSFCNNRFCPCVHNDSLRQWAAFFMRLCVDGCRFYYMHAGVWVLSPVWLTPDTVRSRFCIMLAKHKSSNHSVKFGVNLSSVWIKVCICHFTHSNVSTTLCDTFRVSSNY